MRSTATVRRRPADALVPLSFGQEQVWLHASLDPSLPVYNETFTIKYSGALDVNALEKSLNKVVCRHEAWRTTIEVVDGEPFQRIQAAQPIPFHYVDLTPLSEASREAEARSLAVESTVRLFDLERGPLLRAFVIKVADTDHRLFLTLHHLIFDGGVDSSWFLDPNSWGCIRVLVRESNRACRNLACNMATMPIGSGRDLRRPSSHRLPIGDLN